MYNGTWETEPPLGDGFYWIYSRKWNDLRAEHLTYVSDGDNVEGLCDDQSNWTSFDTYREQGCSFMRIVPPERPKEND